MLFQWKARRPVQQKLCAEHCQRVLSPLFVPMGFRHRRIDVDLESRQTADDDAINSSSAASVPSCAAAASSPNGVCVVAAAGVALVVAAAPAALVADAVSVAGDSNRVAATASASAWR